MVERLTQSVLRRCLLPLFILVLALAVHTNYYASLKVVFSEETLGNIDKWVFTVFVLIVTFFLQRIVSAVIDWYGHSIAEKTSTALDDEFLPLARKLTDFLIWIIAILIILSRFGINTNALIAALGVSSLAIALAAQDTISNIISGFLIVVDRPFRIGDNIKLPSGEKVVVMVIGLRRSRFRAEDGSIIIVPNLELSKSRIVNFTYGQEEKQ